MVDYTPVSLDHSAVASYVAHTWDADIVPALHDYIRIPNVSVAYDRGWAEAGHMARATELLRQWCSDRTDDGLKGASVEVQELPGCTPLLLVEVPATAGGNPDRTVLIYGHLDKQPPFSGWRSGLGPWQPVIEGDVLYGRGAADDGYSTFAALAALEAVRHGGGEHDRIVVLIEASEESGSPDLPAHLEALGDRLGEPALVIALDSWCGDWDRLWVTTSLRGLVDLTLTVEVLNEGIHSGSAGGVVPSSFRILRQLLSRIEDEDTGALLLPQLHVEVPEARRRQIRESAADLGDFAARLPVLRRHPPDGRLGRGHAPRPHLGARARGRGPRRRPDPRGGRQRPAPPHRGQAVGPGAAHGRRPGRRRRPRAHAHRATRRTAPASGSARARPSPAGTPRPSRSGCSTPSTPRRPPPSAAPTGPAARAARSRSWACSAAASPTPGSSSPACSAPTPTPTGPTSSCTCRRPAT